MAVKKWVLVGVLLLVIIAAALGGFIWHKQKEKVSGVTYLPTIAQANKDRLQQLTDNPISSNSTAAKKAAYYYQLGRTYAINNDYKNAIDALLKAETLNPDTLNYSDYMRLAGYYHQLGEAQNAEAALAQASQLVPTSEALGFDSQLVKQQIKDLQQEYKK